MMMGICTLNSHNRITPTIVLPKRTFCGYPGYARPPGRKFARLMAVELACLTFVKDMPRTIRRDNVTSAMLNKKSTPMLVPSYRV